MRQRNFRLWWMLFMLLAALILGGAWVYVNWQSSQTVLPPGLVINDLPMGGMTRNQALNAIALAYTTPISVYYAGELTPPLLPEMVELSLDEEATAENLDEVLQARSRAQGFMDYVMDRLLRREPERQEVRAVVHYSRERVNAYLERTAQKYDHAPQLPVPLPEAGTFRPPRDGTALDVEASLAPLIEALLSANPDERRVELVVQVEPAPEASISILREAINTALADFNGVAGIFAKDLRSGQELCIQCDVAFSGLSTLKIGIALELYRTLDAPPEAEVRRLVQAMLIESDNAAANLLLQRIGRGNVYSGTAQVTDFFRSIGLESTFMAAPYDLKDDVPEPNRVTPANSRSDIDTGPDPYIQTSPVEVGLMLEGLHQCAAGGGVLRIIYPQAITPGECQDILGWMEQNTAQTLLSDGMPPGARVAHKHGWTGEMHADVALVYGPERDFVLAVFLAQSEWLVWEESVPTFASVGQLVYRFFNGAE